MQAGATACDPNGEDGGVTALIESFEGDDRPATVPEDLAGELRSAAREIDPDGLDPQVSVAAAAGHWLATNPGDTEDPDRAIREGTRLFFEGDPPEPVNDWLAARRLG